MSEPGDLRRFRAHRLQRGETVLGFAPCNVGTVSGQGGAYRPGVIIVTERRVVFYSKGWFTEQLDQITIDQITGVDNSATLGVHTITVRAATSILTVRGIWGGADARKLCALIDEQRRSAVAAPVPAVAPAATPVPALAGADLIASLERLSALWKDGTLTEAEFQAQKARLLGP